MAIAPLGTGNDLARVLGWSGDVWDDSRLFSERRVVSTLRRARPQRVDRWSLEIARPRRRSTKKKLFSNYMGIGVDARAALAFDSARKDRRWTWLFVHALTNKLLYAVFGARDFIEHSFAGLKRDVEVTVDGKVIDFPEDTEGIILLNINSFSGGVRMWATRDEFTKSLKDDGVLEIVAVSGALHLGQLNARLAKPVQVAQGRDVSHRAQARFTRANRRRAVASARRGHPARLAQRFVHHAQASASRSESTTCSRVGYARTDSRAKTTTRRRRRATSAARDVAARSRSRSRSRYASRSPRSCSHGVIRSRASALCASGRCNKKSILMASFETYTLLRSFASHRTCRRGRWRPGKW